MEIFYLHILFVCLYFPFETETTCINRTCTHRKRKYKKCQINQITDDEHITSITIAELEDDSDVACVIDKSYGYAEDYIWVDIGCRAKFSVCYTFIFTTDRETTILPSTPSVQSTSLENPFTSTLSSNSSFPVSLMENSGSGSFIWGVLGSMFGFTIVVLGLIFINKRCRNNNPSFNKSIQNDPSSDFRNPVPDQLKEPNESYDTLDELREQHHYKDLQSAETNSEMQSHTYVTLYEPSNCPTNRNNFLNNAMYITGDVKERNVQTKSYGNEQKEYDYAEFNSNQTNTEETCSVQTTTTIEQYAVLDPVVTGYQGGLNIKLETYELAKPLEEKDTADENYISSDEVSYDHMHDNRHKINDNTNTYSHSVDTVYDIANNKHIKTKNNNVNYEINVDNNKVVV